MGISPRSLARILLVSWLFTLLVCFYSDFTQTAADPAGNTPVAHERSGSSEHGGSAQDEDACCTVLQNLPTFFKMGKIEAPLQNLLYALPSFVLVVLSVLLATAKLRFFCTDPPGKPSPLLATNALWPNAPPR
ncbi:MAG TPA: hypothetical protein VMV91_10780 [Rhodocyclaceae bacterium]|nr:hypothetical protein [Rhodocyclaceae bacterium]